MLISTKPRLFYKRMRDGTVRIRKYGQSFYLTKKEVEALRMQLAVDSDSNVLKQAQAGPEVIS